MEVAKSKWGKYSTKKRGKEFCHEAGLLSYIPNLDEFDLTRVFPDVPAPKLYQLKSSFSHIDLDHDGVVSVDDIKSFMSHKHIDLTEEEAKKQVKELDYDGDGVVTLTDFVHCLACEPVPE